LLVLTAIVAAIAVRRVRPPAPKNTLTSVFLNPAKIYFCGDPIFALQKSVSQNSILSLHAIGEQTSLLVLTAIVAAIAVRRVRPPAPKNTLTSVFLNPAKIYFCGDPIFALQKSVSQNSILSLHAIGEQTSLLVLTAIVAAIAVRRVRPPAPKNTDFGVRFIPQQKYLAAYGK
jgi:uncharacterized pyridoxamine 5'-phosphate oxidase family protein